jgi:hypothetical protein
MAGIVEIRDQKPGYLNVDLRNLLSLFKEDGPNLVWSILDLEAVGDAEKLKTDLLEIERQIEESPDGLIVEWEDLLVLAESLVDVWNILIAASHDVPSIPRLEYGTTNFERCEIAIEIFDSTWCRVYARNDAIVRRVKANYRNVRVTQL